MTNSSEQIKRTVDELESVAESFESLMPEIIKGLAARAIEPLMAPEITRATIAAQKIIHSLEIIDDGLEMAELVPEQDVEIGSHSELVGLSARWMSRRAYFTMAAYREHLVLNQLFTPEEVAGTKINRIFRSIEHDVLDYFTERGQRTMWLDPAEVGEQLGLPKSGPKQHILTFIEVKQSQAASPRVPRARKVVESVNATQAVQLTVLEPEIINPKVVSTVDIDALIEIVSRAGGTANAKNLEIAVATELTLTDFETNDLLQTAIAEGRLFKTGIEGRKGYTIAPRAAANSINEQNQPKLDAEAIELKLKKYMMVANYVVNAFAAIKDVTMGIPYHRLWGRANLSDVMEFDEFKFYVRRLEDEGIVRIPTDAKLSSGKGRSKMIRGSLVLIKSPDIRSRCKNDKTRLLRELEDQMLDRMISEIGTA